MARGQSEPDAILPGLTVAGAPAAVRHSWTYGYDGLGRVTSARRGSNTATPFSYDGLDNMHLGEGTARAFGGTKPHQTTGLTGALAGAPSYDLNGSLTMIPGGAAAPARSVSYDYEGRVRTITASAGPTVRSVYDHTGTRAVRLIDEASPNPKATFYFGRRIEVAGAVLTRNIYLGELLIAASPITLPVGHPLRLARTSEAERTMLARLVGLSAGSDGWTPIVHLRGEAAAAVLGLLLLSGAALLFLPGEVRVAIFGVVPRGAYGAAVVVAIVGILPIPRLRPAWAAGGGGTLPMPAYPVFFVGTNQIGSTVVLTCHKQPAGVCADRASYRFYRYDAYGSVTTYNPNGTARSGEWNEPTDRLYTGQTWDAAARTYYYNARFYDPRLAVFLSQDPVRELRNPYAYVGWNPQRFVDPTGKELTKTDLAVFSVVVLSIGVGVYFGGPWGVALINAGLSAGVSHTTTSEPSAVTTTFAWAGGLASGPVGNLAASTARAGAGASAGAARVFGGAAGGAFGNATEFFGSTVGSDQPTSPAEGVKAVLVGAVFGAYGSKVSMSIGTATKGQFPNSADAIANAVTSAQQAATNTMTRADPETQPPVPAAPSGSTVEGGGGGGAMRSERINDYDMRNTFRVGFGPDGDIVGKTNSADGPVRIYH